MVDRHDEIQKLGWGHAGWMGADEREDGGAQPRFS
jgi:hypothetical protein